MKKTVSFLLACFMTCSITACERREKNFGNVVEERTENMIDCSLFQWSVAMSSIGGWIELNSEEENASFECTTERGHFLYANYVEIPGVFKSVTVAPDEGFHWNPEQGDNYETAYIDVVLKIGDRIGGCAVMEIYKDGLAYKGRELQAVLFPQVDGEYQDITAEYVQARLEEIKNE